MRGFFKDRPACSRKNAPGQRLWLVGKDGVKFPVPQGGRRGPRVPARSWSADYLIVTVDDKGAHRGWIRFNHRLERKRRAL